MVTVAVAGGTGGLGYNIVEAALASKKHHVVVLTRSSNQALTDAGADVRKVDYSSHSSVVAALKGVHTIISTVGAEGGMDAFRDTQLALIRAGEEVGAKRFAPSEFSFKETPGMDFFAQKEPVIEAAKASGLEYTKFNVGLFMNLLASGTPKGEKEALAGTRPWNFIINMLAGTADLPGDGTAKVTFTTTTDIAKFVVASLDLDKWEPSMSMAGETISFKDTVKLAEKVTNRKFLVQENSIEHMQELAKDPSKTFYNQTRILIAKGYGNVSPPDLNEKCSDVKPVGMEEFLNKWWAGVDLPEPQWGEDKVFDVGNMGKARE